MGSVSIDPKHFQTLCHRPASPRNPSVQFSVNELLESTGSDSIDFSLPTRILNDKKVRIVVVSVMLKAPAIIPTTPHIHCHLDRRNESAARREMNRSAF